MVAPDATPAGLIGRAKPRTRLIVAVNSGRQAATLLNG